MDGPIVSKRLGRIAFSFMRTRIERTRIERTRIERTRIERVDHRAASGSPPFPRGGGRAGDGGNAVTIDAAALP